MKNLFPTTGSREDYHFRLLIAVSLLLSLLLHFSLFFGLKRVPFLMPGMLIERPPERSVRLEFVDSPERVLTPEEEPKDTNLISDRASLAQDVIPDETELVESPRSVGTTEEKSIRKVPSGAPSGIEEPRRQSTSVNGKERSEEGFYLAGKSGKESRDLSERRSAPGEESPFSYRGRDEFLSPESESPEGKTKILKQVAYNARSPEVAKYLGRIKPKVVNLWHFNIMNNTFYVRTDRTGILFKIMPDGSVGKVIVNEHDGPDIEMSYSLKAIEAAQPFEPLTEEILEYIKEDGLWLEFNFLYQ